MAMLLYAKVHVTFSADRVLICGFTLCLKMRIVQLVATWPKHNVSSKFFQ